MKTLINEDAIKSVGKTIKKLILVGNLDEAGVLLEDYYSPISQKVATAVLMNTAQLNQLSSNTVTMGVAPVNAPQQLAQVKLNFIYIIDNLGPTEIEVQRMLGNSKSSLYKVTSEENLEKILGNKDHKVKIQWLDQARMASKSVCQVVRSDNVKGTGFILKNGYLMTNFHVLPNKERVKSARIIFDFEEDMLGNKRKTSEFFLNADDAAFSPINKFDYAYIKINDNPANPLSQWGYLELDTFSDPQINDPVNIIQHPLGGVKEIALTANNIIAKHDHKLFYDADTERGSSGSPVFNNSWKVIALHHAGKTDEDGGLLVDPATGKKRGANEGVLIKYIVEQIKKTNKSILTN